MHSISEFFRSVVCAEAIIPDGKATATIIAIVKFFSIIFLIYGFVSRKPVHTHKAADSTSHVRI